MQRQRAHTGNGAAKLKVPAAKPAAATPALTPPSAAPSSSPPSTIIAHSGGLTVKAYRGDECVMFAMDLDEKDCANLAGFAIERSSDGGATWTFTPNRLSFNPAKAVSASTDVNAEVDRRDTSDVAPYQKFRWIDFPTAPSAQMVYRVTARYFGEPAGSSANLTNGPSVQIALPLGGDYYQKFRVGFTRGYISSQAFDDRYPGLQELRPADEDPVTFNTNETIPNQNNTTWLAMYEWLGAHGRTVLADYLHECANDPHVATLDIFAYDLDEPDFLRRLVSLKQDAKKTVRVLLDNAPLHTKPGAREIESAKILAAATIEVKRGHFKRFAHDKCVIARDAQGSGIRVQTGSGNFSIRGLYVQSNSFVAIDDPDTAELYCRAFDEAWNEMSAFPSSDIAAEWFDINKPGLPPFGVSFAPHHDASVSLSKVADAIKNAQSSVLFAVMEMGGGGAVLQELCAIQTRSDIFSYGVTQKTTGIKFYKNGDANGLLVPFGFLKDNVPEPFRAEWSGGMGQVIHHKFVVVDFNDLHPIAFFGSSNLAEGGEQSNGDNLLYTTDPAIVTLFAVEAIKLVDHYSFRAKKFAANSKPMMLQAAGDPTPWWQSAYDANDLRCKERLLFVR